MAPPLPPAPTPAELSAAVAVVSAAAERKIYRDWTAPTPTVRVLLPPAADQAPLGSFWGLHSYRGPCACAVCRAEDEEFAFVEPFHYQGSDTCDCPVCRDSALLPRALQLRSVDEQEAASRLLRPAGTELFPPFIDALSRSVANKALAGEDFWKAQHFAVVRERELLEARLADVEQNHRATVLDLQRRLIDALSQNRRQASPRDRSRRPSPSPPAPRRRRRAPTVESLSPPPPTLRRSSRLAAKAGPGKVVKSEKSRK